MSASRRYEILLPLRFNDGKPVADELIGMTLVELEAHFGAISWETQVIHGRWRHGDQGYSDDLVKIVIDVDDTEAHRQFFPRRQSAPEAPIRTN